MKNKLWVLILVLLVVGGCSKKVIETPTVTVLPSTKTGEYSLVIPFSSAPTRAYHGVYLGRADFLELGSRLEEKSQAHFPAKDYYLGEGQVLTYDRLSSLVKRESTENAQGLNPPKDSSFPTGTGISVVDAVVVADVLELNFYNGSQSNPKLAGISFAIVMNQVGTTLINGVSTAYSISDDRLYEYGSDMGRKLVSYIRSITDMEEIPIYVALYSTSSADSTLPGHYFADGYFTARSGQFALSGEQWTIFPSDAATEIDGVTASQFATLRSAIKEFVPENISVIAEGRYVDKKLGFLRITIGVQAKTYTEIHALTQYAAQLMGNFTDKDFSMVIKINSYNSTVALIERQANGDPSIIYTY